MKHNLKLSRRLYSGCVRGADDAVPRFLLYHYYTPLIPHCKLVFAFIMIDLGNITRIFSLKRQYN